MGQQKAGQITVRVVHVVIQEGFLEAYDECYSFGSFRFFSPIKPSETTPPAEK